MLLTNKKVNEYYTNIQNNKLSPLLKRYHNTKRGVLYHKKSLLSQGDVLEENYFEEEIFDLIITSPLYNVDINYNLHKDNLTYKEYLAFSEKWMRNCFKWTKKRGKILFKYILR